MQQRRIAIRDSHSHLMNPVSGTREKAGEWRRELEAGSSVRSQTLHTKNRRDPEEKQAPCHLQESVARF